MNLNETQGLTSNVIPLFSKSSADMQVYTPPIREKPEGETYKKILAKARLLDQKSTYPCDFDYSVYQSLENRFADKPIRGGITFRSPFRLVNSHATCQQCLYSFEIDTYGRGCVHNCTYCYARAELTVHGYWNNPIPVPVDINEVRQVFYNVFETTRPNKYRSIMEQRIPLRIGSMSDSFMWNDSKFKVTKELLKILNFYKYPYVVFTRSDLIARDDYAELIDPKLAAIQQSISSINEDLNKKMEPGAPSAKRRLEALQKLAKQGIWTTVRVNPLFPIYPDGYFTDPMFDKSGSIPKFDFTSFDIVDAIADHGIPALLVGFGRFSSFALNRIKEATDVDLRGFFRPDVVRKSPRDLHYTDREIRFYYNEIRKRCNQRDVQFTTCYIGNGEQHFWKDRDLWSNKKDCCNVKDRVEAFKVDCRQIPFEERLKHTNHKPTCLSDDLHKPLD